MGDFTKMCRSFVVYHTAMLSLALLLLVVTFVGATLALRFRLRKTTATVLAGGYMLAVSFLHILPAVFQDERVDYLPTLVLGGFLFQHLLEYLSRGVEHGHASRPASHAITPYVVTLSLMVHSLLEGLAICVSVHKHWDAVSYLFYWGVLLHKIPVSLAFISVLRHHIATTGGLLLFSFLFALCSPLGMMAGYYLPSLALHEHFITLRAFVSGSFLYIATIIFFESSPDHAYNWKKVLMAGLGVLLGVLSGWLLH